MCSIPGIRILKHEVFKGTQRWINISLPEDQGDFFMLLLTSSSLSSSPQPEIYNVILYSLTFSSWNNSCSFMNYVHNIMFWIPILRCFFCPTGSNRTSAYVGKTPIKSIYSFSIKAKGFCTGTTLQYKRAHTCEILSLFYSTVWFPFECLKWRVSPAYKMQGLELKNDNSVALWSFYYYYFISYHFK